MEAMGSVAYLIPSPAISMHDSVVAQMRSLIVSVDMAKSTERCLVDQRTLWDSLRLCKTEPYTCGGILGASMCETLETEPHQWNIGGR